MDLVLFSAIPKVALFFLLLVAAAIIAEVIYLLKKKMDSPEVTLPKSLQNLPGQKPLPAMAAVTTEVITETTKKGRLTRKTTTIIISTLLIALTIPVGLALVKQRQEIRNQAAGTLTATDCTVNPGQTSCDVSVSWNFTAALNVNYIIRVLKDNQLIDLKGIWHTPLFEENATNCKSDCNCTSYDSCNSKCGYPRCTPQQSGTQTFNLECGKTVVFRLYNLDCNWGNGGCETDNVSAKSSACPQSPTPTPTPTPLPSFSMSCSAIAAFDSNWNQITNLNSIAVNQTIYFTVHGTTNDPQGITKARFRINSDAWQETTQKHGDDFYIQYTVATAGSYTVDAEVFNPALGWK